MFTEYLDRVKLFPLLAPKDERVQFPPATNRAAWEGLKPAAHSEIIEKAAHFAAEPYAMITATQFMAFVRTGDRMAHEMPFFQRRKKLIAATLAECLLYDGTHLDDVIDGIWCICEESFWGLSAHNGSSHPGTRPAHEHPLPDVDNPYIDLFAAQTGALLAWVSYLLKDALDAVAPALCWRIRREVERRIITPFFNHDDFWWMGMIRHDVNNWNPWILSNIMVTMVIMEQDDRRLAQGLTRAMQQLDRYVAAMPNDGGCDEGVSYWNMAGGSLLDALETLRIATGGRVSFYNEARIRNIGLFPLHAHINGKYYLDFADCDAVPLIDGERVYTYGLRIQDMRLASLGFQIATAKPDIFPRDTPEMTRVLNRLFTKLDQVTSVADDKKQVTLPDLQLWALEENGLYAAIKGGHNDESHNHNDVGSFVMYMDGEPKLIDVGNMVYTAKTFGPDRYTLWNIRSANHNVPLIDDQEQCAGREYLAQNVCFSAQEASMDMAKAYPEQAGVSSFTRKLSWHENAWHLSDRITLNKDAKITWVFMLRDKPVIELDRLRFGGMVMQYTDLSVSAEEIPIEDTRMQRSFPGSVWRVTMEAASAAMHERCFQIGRE